MANLTILKALDNLHALVDVDSLNQLEVTDAAELIPHLEEKEEEYWLQAGSDELTQDAIRETFKSVHHHLVHFYDQMREKGENQRLIEGINTIMVLVGEAAAKLEKYGAVFQKKVVEFPEYMELQNFYRTQVIQELFREFAKTPITPSTEERATEESVGVHILNDINIVKQDQLYELFYLKNEAGHDFYTMQLARNIKLACDFGEYAKRYGGDDPLLQVKNWEDRALHLLSKEILNTAKKEIHKFYKGAYRYRDMEIVQKLHMSLMALMLAANPRNLLRQFSQKGCHLYFSDFQMFMRDCLHTREYQRFLVYQPPKDKPFFQDMMHLIFTLMEKFFLIGEPLDEVEKVIKKMIAPSIQKDGLADSLHFGNAALEEVLANHPSGPIFKALDIVREREDRIYDPLMQGNVPTIECRLSNGVDLVRMPAPVRQRYVNRAEIAEEFVTYLRGLERKENEHHLFINFQDRTSWNEHARSFALEELGNLAEFAPVLTVVTLAKDTDFYNQKGIYEKLDHAESFIEQFVHHLGDENTGYFFPAKIKEKMFPTWSVQLLKQIHQTFFAKKQELSHQERVDFITLSYLFIELKLIELVDPTYLTHTSKDGLDVGGTSSVGLLALLHEGKKWNQEEKELLFTILYVPTLLHRERSVHRKRIERLESALRRMEQNAPYLKDFEKLFQQATLKTNISP